MTIKKEEVVSLGIVLKTHPYKESDSLVTVYFKDYGKMTLIARGVKKLKSKNASACQSLTLSEGVVLIDVREADEFAEGHVKGAVNVPLSTFKPGILMLMGKMPNVFHLHCPQTYTNRHIVL